MALRLSGQSLVCWKPGKAGHTFVSISVSNHPPHCETKTILRLSAEKQRITCNLTSVYSRLFSSGFSSHVISYYISKRCEKPPFAGEDPLRPNQPRLLGHAVTRRRQPEHQVARQKHQGDAEQNQPNMLTHYMPHQRRRLPGMDSFHLH